MFHFILFKIAAALTHINTGNPQQAQLKKHKQNYNDIKKNIEIVLPGENTIGKKDTYRYISKHDCNVFPNWIN